MKNSKKNSEEKNTADSLKNVTAKKSKKKAPATDQNAEQNFPGYPHYPKSEDILEQKEVERVEVNDMENLSSSRKINPENKTPQNNSEPVAGTDDEVKEVRASEADLTKDDLIALGSDELNSDLGDDEQLKDRIFPVDMTGEDLDVPGAELDDADENIGEEDEENNSYSIGGDRHEV